jgi:hypothetical protein
MDCMKKLAPPNLVAAILSAGYNLDFTDADAIDRLGIHLQILILPPTDRIPKDVLEKIVDFAADGGKVIAVGKSPSMSPAGEPPNIPSVCGRREGRENPTSCHSLFDTAAHAFVADPSQLDEALHDATQPDIQLIDADNGKVFSL